MQILAIEADDPGILLNIGVSLEKQGRAADAEPVYREGLALAMQAGNSEQTFNAYYNLGSMHWKLRSWRRAAEMFERAVEIKPDDARVRAFAVRARGKAGS